MRKKLSDYLVFCDIDNTLLTQNEPMPSCNLAVIKLFTALGGRFTVATGRPPESIRAALGGLPLSFPAIACNGSLIYDFQTDTVLRHETLGRVQAQNAITDIMKNFQRVGVEIYATDGKLYTVRANRYTYNHQQDERLNNILYPLDCLPDGWSKAVFASDPETIRRLSQYAKTRFYGRENYFMVTSNTFLELMPSGVGKASALRDVCFLMQIPIQNTIVIGDYYSDLELMRTAGYSVAVANAPTEVRTAANHVTMCTCSEGGVGEYLYDLIRQCEQEETG